MTPDAVKRKTSCPSRSDEESRGASSPLPPTWRRLLGCGYNRRMAEGTRTATGLLDKMVQDPSKLIHFVGIGGTGMSALAQYRAMGGGRASGSDRGFDQDPSPAARAWADRLGIAISPQDGSGVSGADLVVTSTAVEDSIADVRIAREHGIPIAHRAELLAAIVRLARPSRSRAAAENPRQSRWSSRRCAAPDSTRDC